MNKLIIFALTLLSLQALASDGPSLTSTQEVEGADKKFNSYKGHWLTSFGFETGKYEVPWEFSGAEKNLKPTEQDLTGGRLGFGREIYIGKGFMTSTKVEGYYIGTLFTKAINAGPEDTNIEFASTKKSGSVWGVDAVQSLSYLFDMKTKNPFMNEWTYLTVEPFIEAGIGKGYAYQRINYKYELQTVNEAHRQRLADDFTNARIGAGINFTSGSGYFLYMRATQNRYDITQRKMRTTTRPNGGSTTSTTETFRDTKIDPVTIYALGGGYKF